MTIPPIYILCQYFTLIIQNLKQGWYKRLEILGPLIPNQVSGLPGTMANKGRGPRVGFLLATASLT